MGSFWRSVCGSYNEPADSMGFYLCRLPQAAVDRDHCPVDDHLALDDRLVVSAVAYLEAISVGVRKMSWNCMCSRDDLHGGRAGAATANEVGRLVEIDLEVERDLGRVLELVPGTKQLLETPFSHRISRCFER
jgi:hypothetical protein